MDEIYPIPAICARVEPEWPEMIVFAAVRLAHSRWGAVLVQANV